jgi:hypothetical protein
VSLEIETARQWSDHELLLAYESRIELQKSLGGWLYQSIVSYEIIQLDDIARGRYQETIGTWRDAGIVPTTWTDEFSVVHEWRSLLSALRRGMNLYRVDIAGIVHVEAFIPGQRHLEYWTPMCQPNEDWLILKDSAVPSPPTCLWCVAHARFK